MPHNTLSVLREGLVSILSGAGLEVVSYLPSRPNPPIAIVTSGQPYVSPADRFGFHTVTLTVLLLTRKAENDQATANLDWMIAQAAVAVTDSDFALAEADQPASFQVNNTTYLGCTLDITYSCHLEVE